MPARTCEICGLRSAVYVCREGRRFVCPNCQSGPMCKDYQIRSAAGPRSTRGARTFPLLPTLAVMAVLAGVSLVILGSLTGSSSTGSSSTCFLWPIPPIIACGFSSSSGQGLAFPALVSVVLMIIFGLFLSTFQWRRSDGELDA